MSDPDNKLREYVLKKQQQRERARLLRAQRRNQEYDSGDAQYPANQYQKYRPKKRIIGDPFASSENKENTFAYQQQQAPPQLQPLQQQISSSCDNVKEPFRYQTHSQHSHNAMRPNSNSRNQSYRQQQPKPRTPSNNEAFNNKILSMMEVFKSEINSLNEEVSDLKAQNHELKQGMIQLQRHSQTQSMSSNMTMPAIAIPKYSNASSNSSYRSSMGSAQNNQCTLNPPKSIRMSKSLRKLKIKKKQHSARVPVTSRQEVDQHHNCNNHFGAHPNSNQQNHAMMDRPNGYNHKPMQHLQQEQPRQQPRAQQPMRPKNNKHAASANAFVNRLSELEGVTEDIEQQRIECRGCGRKFIRSALERHAKICKKVFQSKRKKFNIERVDKEAKNAQNSGGGDEYKLKKMRKKKKQSWKAKSSMLRDAIRASKGYDEAVKNGRPTDTIPYQSSTYDDRVECPHCNRKFSEQAAERHIPRCRDIRAKPKTLKRKQNRY